ncbi:MAG: thioredoxin domain-containing protein [Planctomycetaceae bacterium]|nr:thioredoxin domain-containing protein [Planctomycetaceae bacterium]
MSSSSDRTPNRLQHETSPYLLQHAYNPVDWWPWGEAAFAAARDADKPVFLSVGYSACHWCHVMERESFENEAIAAIMNEHYINIKVDREERPDVDQIYMTAVQLMTHHGGWPMSVFMTPDGHPFYGGTYWPPTSRMNMPGFRDILLKLHEYWTQRREEVVTSADSLVNAISQMSAPNLEPTDLNAALLQNAMQALLGSADRRHGGFGGAPKFPHPMDVRVLFRCWRRFDNDDALAVARLTLDKMANGGIYDHLGGGFHRYSTDAHWLVPHFEKMLYDNALLVPAYLELHQCTGDAAPLSVVRETLDYILREMTAPDGGFYSTQDADSEGEEGRFFVWTEDEIIEQLGPEDGRVFNYCYDVTPRGNWEGHTILNRPKTDEQAAKVLGLTTGQLVDILARGRAKLFALRKQRVHPGRDDKVLVAWNGLMIVAMSQAAGVLGEPKYAAAAEEAAAFVLKSMRDDQGRLLHSYKDGRAQINAFLDDHACLIDGLVELYQATFAPRWLDEAVELAGQLTTRYSDPGNGGFFYTPDDHEQLITRTKDAHDSATPSGNGMAATALLKLGRMTGRTDLEEAGYQALEFLSGVMAEQPRASAQALLALDFHLGPSPEIVLIDGESPAHTDDVLRALRSQFLPNRIVVRGPLATTTPVLQPLLNGRAAIDGRVTAYVCERGACGLPVSGSDAILAALRNLQRGSKSAS